MVIITEFNNRCSLLFLRYEREINNTHRSALKLIIEGDGTASMPMVLCVSDIIEEEVTPITLGNVSNNTNLGKYFE